MQDYGSLVYLDVQKTGSSFVLEFLEASCKLALQPSRKHARIVGKYRRDAYYFITVRHPLAQYVSLFRYGLDQKGAIHHRIRRKGRADLYERGLEPWLEFMLDDRNVSIIGEDFEAMAGSGVGFMTFRFMALSIANPVSALKQARSVADVRKLYAEQNLARRVIRNESLNEGLRTLAFDDVPQWFDRDAAAAYLDAAGRVNPSQAPAPALPSADLLGEFRRREAFLLDLFYSDKVEAQGGA